MALYFDGACSLGGFKVAANFTVSQGLTVLFGRSGSGKTSLINMIAGLLTPARGRITLNDQVLFDHDRGINVATHCRDIGYVFQEDRLFPHLNVRRNLIYGRKQTRSETGYATMDSIIEMLGIGALLDRGTATLSGGERQRIAIARALLSNPSALLMDEPLASLDAARKADILPYIERLRDEMHIPIVYVTHSQEEVTRLATTLVLIADGQVAALGPVSEVMSRTDLGTLAGADGAGSVLATRVARHEREDHLTVLEFSGGTLRVPQINLPPGATLHVQVRARDVALSSQLLHGVSILNQLPAVVSAIGEQTGPYAEIQLSLGDALLLARITKASARNMQLQIGTPVYALVKSIAFDRHSLGYRS